ncbi:hypothetical protein H4Q26_008440 [Puccinia striiformis f. sp. tritici PST-130]|nr:hypothetical protein H4Q26_008440 [Puccinia striiformis f. sp. tritici PST-130]
MENSRTTTTPAAATTRTQPSSFPFLIIIELQRTIDQRKLELEGLKQYIFKNNASSITSQLVYHLPNQTFGARIDLPEAQRFISHWYHQLNARSNLDNTPLYWRNISGHIKGNWKWRKESTDWWPNHHHHQENQTSIDSQRGPFDWTPPKDTASNSSAFIIPDKWTFPSHQKIDFNLRESSNDHHQNTSMVRGSMYISSDLSKDVVLEVEALDVPSAYLLNLTQNINNNNKTINGTENHTLNLNINPPTPEQKLIGAAIIDDYVNRIKKITSMLKKGDLPRSSNDGRDGYEQDPTNCTFIIYGGLTPIPRTTIQTRESLEEYEQSLIKPSGAKLLNPIPSSKPIFQALLISTNCGLVLESSEMSVLLGTRFGIKLLVMLRLLPSFSDYNAGYWSGKWTLDRVLLYGALIRMHTPSTSSTSAPTTTTVVTNTESSTERVTVNEEQEHNEQTPDRDTDYVQVPTTDLEDSIIDHPVPTPSTTQLSRPRRLISSVSNLLTNRPLISISFIGLCLFIIPFLLYSWQPLILFILFSYWIPQIVHNVQHGTSRRGLRKRYVLGTTLYLGMSQQRTFCYCESMDMVNKFIFNKSIDNINLTRLFRSAIFLIWVLFSYDPIWDYHPIKLPSKVDLEEGEISIEKMPECVICFEPIDVLPSSPTLSTCSLLSDHDHSTPDSPHWFSGTVRLALLRLLRFRSLPSRDQMINIILSSLGGLIWFLLVIISLILNVSKAGLLSNLNGPIPAIEIRDSLQGEALGIENSGSREQVRRYLESVPHFAQQVTIFPELVPKDSLKNEFIHLTEYLENFEKGKAFQSLRIYDRKSAQDILEQRNHLKAFHQLVLARVQQKIIDSNPKAKSSHYVNVKKDAISKNKIARKKWWIPLNKISDWFMPQKNDYKRENYTDVMVMILEKAMIESLSKILLDIDSLKSKHPSTWHPTFLKLQNHVFQIIAYLMKKLRNPSFGIDFNKDFFGRLERYIGAESISEESLEIFKTSDPNYTRIKRDLEILVKIFMVDQPSTSEERFIVECRPISFCILEFVRDNYGEELLQINQNNETDQLIKKRMDFMSAYYQKSAELLNIVHYLEGGVESDIQGHKCLTDVEIKRRI